MKVEVNKAYSILTKTAKRYRVLKGGAGAGKSYAIAQLELIELLQRKHKLLALRKVQRTLRDSVFSLFLSLLNEWKIPARANRVELRITLPNGSEIICMGLDDTEKLKSVAGITRIFIEEATEISEEDFNQVDLRLRGAHLEAPAITLAFNPISKEHWLYSRFFHSTPEDALTLETTYKDNSFLDDHYAKVLQGLKERDENYYRIYCLGEWGVASKGLIFPDWSSASEWPEKGRQIFGLDFGFSSDPTALVEIRLFEEELYIRQLLYKTGLTNTDLAEHLANLVPKGGRIIADSSEPQRIEELRRKGFNVHPARKGPDSIRAGIDAVKSFRIFVYADSLDLVKELRHYKYKEDKEGNFLPVPVDYLNHALDATRYAVQSVIHTKARKIRIFNLV